MKNITKPTFLISESKLSNNITKMRDKAELSGVVFRPHFKTHQSNEVGEVYRRLGISKITVSSIDMALFFAKNGWNDITIAFPVNIRQIDDLNRLANIITLHLLVESTETIQFLQENLESRVNIWIKIDIDYNRTGIPYKDQDKILETANLIQKYDNLIFKGLLTHAGHAYTLNYDHKRAIYVKSVFEMSRLKTFLISKGFDNVQLSYGDTPTCSIFDDFSSFNEIRPGNFAFYDLTQLQILSCTEDQIAVLVACPVVAKHNISNKIIVHGGGVHFSKDFIVEDGTKIYGYLVGHNDDLWWKITEENFLFSISQDHGEVKIKDKEFFNKIKVGDLLYFYPVHSCMTADLMKENTIFID